jgi:hypothetical protein
VEKSEQELKQLKKNLLEVQGALFKQTIIEQADLAQVLAIIKMVRKTILLKMNGFNHLMIVRELFDLWTLVNG